jgi:hypothetical protein
MSLSPEPVFCKITNKTIDIAYPNYMFITNILNMLDDDQQVITCTSCNISAGCRIIDGSPSLISHILPIFYILNMIDVNASFQLINPKKFSLD